MSRKVYISFCAICSQSAYWLLKVFGEIATPVFKISHLHQCIKLTSGIFRYVPFSTGIYHFGCQSFAEISWSKKIFVTQSAELYN